MKRFNYVFKLLLVFSLLLWQFPAGSAARDIVKLPDSIAEDKTDENSKDSQVTSPAVGGMTVTDLTEGTTAEALVNEILGKGVEVRNAVYSGAPVAAGVFADPNNTFGFSRGFILSSGSVKGVIGTNTIEDFSTANDMPGDPELEALLGDEGETLDAAVLEFEFKPASDKISFQYVLASEEYPEYLSYSDAFAFFANGMNVALIPGTTDPVTISNINHERNAQYFKSNEGGVYQTEMDGMTKVLSAEATVTPGQWNRMKLVIADYGDDSYDSNVLIKANSFKAGGAKAGTFKTGSITHTYDESTGRVTAHTEAIRENGSEGDVTLYWERNTSEGTMQVAVDFPDGVTKQTLSIDFPKEETMAIIKLLDATATAGIDENDSLEYLHIKQLTADSNQIVMIEGDSAPLEIRAYNFDDAELGLDEAHIHSSNGSVVEYGDNGMLFALAKGESTVSVQYGGHSVEIAVKVMPAVTDLHVEPQSVELEQNTGKELKVYAQSADGTKEDVTHQASYTSSDESIFTIDQSGNIIGVGVGSAEATVQFMHFTKTIPVKVTKAPEITKLEVVPSSINITEGDIEPLKVIAHYDDGSTEDITEQAAFTIKDTTIAELSAEWHIIALSAGITEMTVEFAGVSKTVPIEIKALPKGLLLNIVDEKNKPVHNVSLAIEYEAGKFEKFTVNNPYTNELTSGKYKLYIYKQGYQPVYKEIEIKEKQQTTVTARLVKAELVSSSWSVEKMTMNEIVEAGIDPNDPDNRWVYKFEMHLALNGEQQSIPYIINGNGKIFDGEPGVIGGMRFYPIAVPFEDREDIPPMVGYMIIPGEVSWLKEFFEVKLALTNLASQPFTLKESNVTLSLPEGLSLAPTADSQSLHVNIGEIAGGETGKAEWVLRGDQKGSYHLSADFSSKLFPLNEEVKASFKTSEPLTVWGESAIRILAQVEKEVHRGMPYLVRFSVINVSDGPVNDLRLKLLEDGKLNYFYSPKQQLEYNIPALAAGEYKTFEYLLVPTVNANIDLSQSFTLQTGGNATVEIIIATIN